jgi:hypothetical protein
LQGKHLKKSTASQPVKLDSVPQTLKNCFFQNKQKDESGELL